MTDQPIVKRSGKIENYSVSRAQASFVFSDSDRNKLGAVAIAASLAGLGGQAIATASYAASAEEPADYFEFDLDGLPVKGWVWRSPFKEGDQVEVVGEIHGNHLEAVAIARHGDRTIALYPHCSRGRARHIANATKWWFVGCTTFNLLTFALGLTQISLDELAADIRGTSTPLVLAGSVYVFFGMMTISLTRKWMPFVRLAEKVFRALGLPNPSNIDLVKSSKAQRKPTDPGEYGTFYFRY